VIGAVALRGCSNFLSWLEIDGCLDGGGKWDYQFKKCIGSRHAEDEAAAGAMISRTHSG